MKTKFNLLIITLFSICSSMHAQVFTSVPAITAKLNYSYVSDNLNLAIAGGVEHYISSNQGVTWTELNNGVGTGLYQLEGYNIAVKDASTMYIVGKVGSNHIVSKSTDGGTNWATVFSVSSTEQLTDIAVHGNTVIISGRNGVYQSLDGGTTWTFIQLSMLNVSSPFIRYNENGNSWIVSGYAQGVHISTDDGSTWNEVDFGFASSEIVAASHSANGVVLTRTISSGSKLIFLNPVNLLDTITNIDKNLQVNGNNPCKNAVFLPNNKLLTFDVGFFYIVDSSNQEVYHVTSPYGNGYSPKNISLGSNYGIAITYNSGGNLGRIYRIDLNQPPTLYVPSNFQIAGPGPCAGDNIVGIPYADYADSNKWYVNNILTSTALQLNYPTPPGVYGTYTIKLNTYFNGLISTTTQTVTFQAPQAPHSFAYTVDTTACYGLPLHVFINPDAGSPVSTAVKILYNGQLVAGPYNMTSSNINAYTPALTTSGVLQIISYKTLYCDPSADTVTLNIEVGPNLFDLEILPHDSVICVGVNPSLAVNGTNSLISYDFSTSYSMNGFTDSPHTIVSGNSGGTLNIQQYGLEANINNSTMPETYGPMYMFVNLEITDTAGCSPTQVIDTIRIQRSIAYYELHSRSYLTGDTVHMTNAFITPNRQWSSSNLNSTFIENATDVVPLVVADTTGLFSIKLRNAPLPGCIDSTTHYVYYAEAALEMDTACQITTPHIDERIHHVRMDPFGNIYEIATSALTVHYRPAYILRKNDAFGNMLWEKRANEIPFGNDIQGVAIEEIDFDPQGNPVIVMWIHGTSDYEDDYVDYQFSQVLNAQQGACYVIKIDKTTGELIWASDLDYISADITLNTGCRVTDVIVDGEWIHATTWDNFKLVFFTLKNSNGTLANAESVDIGSAFIPPGFLGPSSSVGDNRQSYWSPQIDILSTGEVIAIGNYQDIASPLIPNPIMYSSGSGIFAMKYHPDNGIYDITTIARTGKWQFAPGNGYLGHRYVPKMFVDKNDNITVAGKWEYFYWDNYPNNVVVSVLDSILPMETGSFVMNMTPDYQMNWLATAPHSEIEDLVYVPVTGETYLSCKTSDNFTLMNGNTVIMSGSDKTYDLTYTELPVPVYPWQNYSENNAYLSKLDENGKPLSMKSFRGIAPNNSQQTLYQRITASPCGDIAVLTTSIYSQGAMEVDGQIIPLDSTKLFLLYSDCSTEDCSYLNSPDSITLCSTNSSFQIQLSNYFNLDSLTYDIVVNGATILSNQSTLVEDGHFPINQPQGSSDGFTIHFNYPNEDTLVINYFIIPVDFGSAPTEPFCDTDPPFQLGNGTPAPGQYYGLGINGTQFYPTLVDPGEYTFIYFYNNQNGCIVSDTALFIVNNCAGTDVIDAGVYDLYPNPFTSEFVIESKQTTSQQETIVVYDQVGKIVYQTVLDSPKKVLNLESLANGNYLLEIKDQRHSLLRKRILKTN